ncbi:amino acid ABC transporter permease [Nocardioides hungaricus]
MRPAGHSSRADAFPTVVKLRRPGRTAAQVATVLAAAVVVWNLVGNDRFNWPLVWHYFTSERILNSLLVTLGLTAVSMVAGAVLGVVLAIMRNSPARLVSGLASGYVWFFRGTPLLVQLIFWFNISALYPEIGLGVPFGGPKFLTLDANSFVTPLLAAVVGLSLNEAAYMAEIVRGGILAVDAGQADAATALGMSRLETMRHVILPQAMRVIIPPTGNELINMLKSTSLVSVVAVSDLMYTAQLIYTSNYQTIPLLVVASLWYLVITSVLSVGQFYLERHFSRSVASSNARVAPPRAPTQDSDDQIATTHN